MPAKDRHQLNRHLYVAQRATAMLLAPLVVIHLVLIMIAVDGGLSAQEILSRTRGNYLWGTFYTLFVLAAAIHAPIGMRNVLVEWTSLPSKTVDLIVVVLGLFMLFAGMRAVVAVI